MLEGTYQKNCATTYISEIGRGVAYLYSVHSPERATVALRRDTPDGEWYLHDLRALNNSEVSAETNTHVYEWLRSQLPSHENKPNAVQSENQKTSSSNPTP
ncbi:MAG: hypothetical protein Q7S40_18715 [Opitutaceae bacterium]|nr:hypothetical protein [Opitutaceae bacterium]